MSESEPVNKISIGSISDPVSPMRTDLDADTIKELAESVKRHGLINPITVRPTPKGYEVVAGHRRFKACQLIGLPEIPCIIKELNDMQVVEIMAAENLERQDVDPVDEALFIGRLLNLPGMDINTVANKLNRSELWVQERLDILDYPDYLVIAVKQGTIKLGVAKWLARIGEETYRKMYAESAIKNGMSVLQAQYAFRQYEVGVMPNLDQLEEAAEAAFAGEPPKVRAMCARCNEVAEAPNLRMVWIHIDCEQNKLPPPRDPKEMLPPV